eukprot:GFKZ01014001.1.p1 GENE.GFKZ01014001.1~~GFKZ01014001.1.p1  ORF type:complete len:916 (+),score=94.46 GFKZ01014001.1:235-2982(+)
MPSPPLPPPPPLEPLPHFPSTSGLRTQIPLPAMQLAHISNASSSPRDPPNARVSLPSQPAGNPRTPRSSQPDLPSASNQPSPIFDPTDSPNPCPARKRRAHLGINYAQKRRLCELSEQYPKAGHELLAKKFRDETGRLLERSTVSRVLQRKDTWANVDKSDEHRRRCTSPRFPIIDEIMWELIRSRAIVPSFRKDLGDRELVKMTRDVAQILGKHGGNQKSHINYVTGLDSFKGSASWVSSFKKRFRIGLEKGESARSSCLERSLDIWANETNIQETKRLLCNWTRFEDFYFLEASVLATAVLPEQVAEETLSSSSAVSRDSEVEAEDAMRLLLSLQNYETGGNGLELAGAGFPSLNLTLPPINHTMPGSVGTGVAGSLHPSSITPVGTVSGSAVATADAQMSAGTAEQMTTTGVGHINPVSSDPTLLGGVAPVQMTSLEPITSNSARHPNTSLTDAMPPPHQPIRAGTGGVPNAHGLRPINSMAGGSSNISVCPTNTNVAGVINAAVGDSPPLGRGFQCLGAGTTRDPINTRVIQFSRDGASSGGNNQTRYSEPPAVNNQRILDDDTVIVLLLCSNGTGKQLAPWIVGKQPLRQVGRKEGEVWCDSKTRYFHNMRGWLTFRIVRMWLEEFDKSLDRSVVLLSSLLTGPDLAQLKLKNVTVVPIPRSDDVQDYSMNSLSRPKLTPLYSGIEEHFRANYRSLVVDRAIGYVSRETKIKPLSLRTAAKFVQEAWEAVPKAVVRKAWRQHSYIPSSILRSASSLRVNAHSLNEKQLSKLSDTVQRYKNALELNSTDSSDKIEVTMTSPKPYVWWSMEGPVLHPMGTLSDFVRSVCKTDTGHGDSSDEESADPEEEPVERIRDYRDALRVANNLAAFMRAEDSGDNRGHCLYLISSLQSEFKNLVEQVDDEEQKRAWQN